MQVVDYRLRLNLLTNGSQGSIRVKRGENGARRLIVRLYTDSSPYIPGEGVTAVFRAKKPDSTILYNDATINDNTVTVDLTTQTVASAGTVTCELSLYGTNNELLYSPQFDVIVEDYLYSDSEIESTSEYTALTEAVSTVNDIKTTEAARADAETARVAAETARENAEAERETAETARETAEAERVTAENTRVSAETTRKTLYNQWANATASVYKSLEPYVQLYDKAGHKEFVFGLPSISKERNTIEMTELKNLARQFTGFVFYDLDEVNSDLSNYDLPIGISKSFVLSTGPLETVESGTRLYSCDIPQTIFDGQNIYMRRLGITEEGTGSEADPIMVTYSGEAWQQVGEGGSITADGIKNALGYTPAAETDIPTALKNPYALSFTGGASGSYDGSTAKSVNIPTTLKNPNALGITLGGNAEQKYDGSESLSITITPGLIGAATALAVAKAQSTADSANTLADTANNTANAALPLAGGTMTGALVLSGDPTEDNGAATKAYVDTFIKAVVPTQAVALPDSGTALNINTFYYAVTDGINTYNFVPPGYYFGAWAHGYFKTGDSPAITFEGSVIGSLPTFNANSIYEFDVYWGVWIVQEVTQQ